MGDMADYFLEQVWDEEDARLDYRMGHMSTEEAFERGIIDEFGAEYHHGRNFTASGGSKTCRCCGTRGLVWGQHKGKWRLFEGQKIHKCLQNPLKD